MSSPFKYTDRTYTTILNAINSISELSDKPNWWKKYTAGLGDVFSVIIDAVANDSLLGTALTRESTQALLRLIDYELGTVTTATGVNIFNVKLTTPNGTVFTPADLIVSTQGNTQASAKKYQARENVTYNLSGANFVRSSATVFTTAFDVQYTGKLCQLTTTGTLPAGLSTGTDYYTIYINSTSFSLATSLENAFNGIAVSTGDVGVGTHTASFYSFASTLYQQESKDPVVIGQSDGTTSFQEFTLPDSNILIDTLTITIGGDVYTQVTTLAESSPTDKVYLVLNKSNGIIAVMFGNNEFGVIPPILDITAEYKIGGGILANQSNLNIINVYSGGNSEIVASVNATPYTEGANEESFETAKIRAPILLKAQNRFVTKEDGEALMLDLGGISYAYIIPNASGVLTATALAVAIGGGNVSSGKKTEIKDELENKSILDSVTVTVSDITFIDPTVVCNIRINSGFTFSSVSTQANLAIKLFFTETARELKEEYLANGLSGAITLINNIFSTSFSNADLWIGTLLNTLDPISVNQRIDSIDLLSFVKCGVSGIDDINTSSPTFPINLGTDELTTAPSSITINQVV